MLRSYLLIAGVSAASFALLTQGCGGSDNDTTPGGSGGKGSGTSTASSGSGGGEGTGTHAAPPGAPANKPTDGTGDVTFAIKKLYLGDTNRDGTPNKTNGWKQYGFDLDGKISTASSTDLCRPRNNANPKNLFPDGDNGIDNSFGKNILGLIVSLQQDASVKVNEAIATGSFTVMLSMEKLGTGNEYNPILTRLYGGASLPAAPLFDGTDKWPVRPELLTNPMDIKTAKVQFAQSYLVKNTWVSGTKGNLDLDLTISGFSLKLTIASAVITMDLDEAHKGASKGTIAGVIATDSLTAELRKVAGAFDKTLCNGAAIDSLVAQIEAASDILKDGSQDPAKSCDGISIGLGFDAAAVQLGEVADPSMPAADPCAMP